MKRKIVFCFSSGQREPDGTQLALQRELTSSHQYKVLRIDQRGLETVPQKLNTLAAHPEKLDLVPRTP